MALMPSLDIRPRDRKALLDELWMSLCATVTQIEDYLDDGVPLIIRYKFSYGTDPKWLLKNELQRRIGEIIAKAQMEGPK